MQVTPRPDGHHPTIPPAWQQLVKCYQQSDLKRSLWQVVNTFVPFFLIWYAAYRSLEYSYLLTLLLALLIAGMSLWIGFWPDRKSTRLNSSH